MKRVLVEDMTLSLKEMLGDRIAEPQRVELARKVVDALELENTAEKAQPETPGMPGEGEDKEKDEAEFIPLSFVLKVPGKILASDGEIDRATGQVFWDFYAQSAELEDVVLTATFESKP